MNSQEIRTVVLRVLGQIAPEADLATIKSDVSLRDQLDIDSMDYLNFLIGVNNELHIDIPERDYGKLATLDACVDYLAARQDSGRAG
jgi:acyl carrier protein